MALGVPLAGVETEQCDVGDVFIRLHARGKVFAGERGIVIIPEKGAVSIQTQTKNHGQQHKDGQNPHEPALEAFDRHKISPVQDTRTNAR